MLYNKSYFALRNDRQTEYLEDKELNKRFADLISDVIDENNRFKNQSKLKKKIEEFLEEIVKSIEKHKILFKIQNFDVELEEITFWDCIIARYDKKVLIEWGFSPDKKDFFNFEDFENQNVIIVEEEGNKNSEIVKRARIKASRRLRALQSYLKVENIHDFQLFFENNFSVYDEEDDSFEDIENYILFEIEKLELNTKITKSNISN